MHPPGLFQILVIGLILLVLFGRGRITRSMNELGEGVKAIRKRLDEDDAAEALPGDRVYREPALEAHSAADN